MKGCVFLSFVSSVLLVPAMVFAEAAGSEVGELVSDQVISDQRARLVESVVSGGFGPQAPQDIDLVTGSNTVSFGSAPEAARMNLCNIHFHKNAEHKGGAFTVYAGNGDGYGNQTGYKYSGELAEAELVPVDYAVCPGEHGSLQSGDTIEVHYVYTTARVGPGPTLGACLSDSVRNPQLRVESQVYVLVNDAGASDFRQLVAHGERGGYHQALGVPNDTGRPVEYAGSTTGPGYNEKGSPFQVTWSVRPGVAKVGIESVGKWCEGNVFGESGAHGVRNLVVSPDLISNAQ